MMKSTKGAKKDRHEISSTTAVTLLVLAEGRTFQELLDMETIPAKDGETNSIPHNVIRKIITVIIYLQIKQHYVDVNIHHKLSSFT